MLNNLKPLVVVLFFATLVFWLAKPLALRFMAEADYVRRRNVWFALTVTAFVSPSFWFYLLFAVPLLAWIASKDKNPMALTLLFMHVIPPMSIELPAIAINRLFDLSNYRVLALVVLLPAAIRIASERRVAAGGYRFADICIVGYCLLTLVLLIPYESPTNTMRRVFLLGVDIGLVYYVFSRLSVQRERVVEAMACFAISMLFISSIAVFEWARSWLMYTGINDRWGDPNVLAWLMREGALRAQASSGHALSLGYMCAMALGVWLYLQHRVESRHARWGVTLILLAGAYASVSRGPWIVAALVYLAYCLLGPLSAIQVAQRFAVIAFAGIAALVSPYGDSLMSYLPFVGTVDAANVTYRQELATLSWQLIQQNPFFGSPFVLTQMESLRQGQGIIDLVNSYASIAMFYGIVGLVLLLAPFLLGLGRLIVLARARRRAHPNEHSDAAAASVAACMIGTLLMLALSSFGTILAFLYWVLAAVAVGLSTKSAEVRASPGAVSQTAGWQRRNAARGVRASV